MRPNSVVIYRGPSRIDYRPIMVILTGIRSASGNRKTGGMLQTFILNEEISPVRSMLTGADESICGSCPLRPYLAKARDKRHPAPLKASRCYVQVGQAPQSVWSAYRRGNVPEVSSDEAIRLVTGRKLRIGTYGDPSAVPFEVWSPLAAVASTVTGYTHSAVTWSPYDERVGELSRLAMISAGSRDEASISWDLGRRTFRVIRPGESLASNEILCPASKEAGSRTTCDRCGLCDGLRRSATRMLPSVAIIDHGPTRVRHSEVSA